MFGLLLVTAIGQQQPAPRFTPADFHRELVVARKDTAAAQRLSAGVQRWFGKQNLDKNNTLKQDGLHAVWAILAPNAKTAPKVVAADGSFTLQLEALGADGLYVGEAVRPDGDGFNWAFEVDGAPVGGGGAEFYRPHPDMAVKPGVPKGVLTKMPDFLSKTFEGTKREWWVYVPAGLKPGEEACTMVFQDGQGSKNNVPAALDNLIARGELPKIVGIFISPGTFIADGRSNRSVEYDTLSDKYSKFLLEEIIPEVEKKVKLSTDPDKRAISGSSSGAICAFTVAWQRPDAFRKVLSFIGSYVNLQGGKTLFEGGHNYPPMIRKIDKKPIRVFLQDGINDLDNPFGNWPLANQGMAKSLAYKGYDYKFVLGKGAHNGRHANAIMPDALKWLWR